MKTARSIVATLAAAVLLSLSLPALAVPAPGTDLVRPAGLMAALPVTGLETADEARVQALWGEFVTSIPAQAACLLTNPPSFEARGDMAPRAAYAPASATLYVKPGDLDRLVVFHELGHHLDFACGAAEEIGEELRHAQGIAASKPWWKHGSPVTWPAEYFANAVAIALGETSRHDVTAETVTVVEEWMGRASGSTLEVEQPPLLLGGTGSDALRLT